MTNRVFTFLYGAVSYAFFFATFLYAIGFVGNFAVHKSLDSVPASAWPTALLADLGLLALFVCAPSALARPCQGTSGAPGSTDRSVLVHATLCLLNRERSRLDETSSVSLAGQGLRREQIVRQRRLVAS